MATTTKNQSLIKKSTLNLVKKNMNVIAITNAMILFLKKNTLIRLQELIEN